MHTLTLSAKYEVVIPEAIRDILRLRPGQELHALVRDNRIELIPVRVASELRGFLKGIDTSVKRDPERE